MGETVVVDRSVKKETSERNDLLKIIALVTMLIDHIGYMYFPGEMLFRTIGRLAFPIFAYQIAMGYSKTSSLKRYVQRLVLFALAAQVPYTVFNPKLVFRPLHFNVLFMFLAAIAVLYFYDMAILKVRDFILNKDFGSLVAGILLFIYIFIISILPEIIVLTVRGFSFEYGFLGITMVLLFHIFKENRTAAIISIVLLYIIDGYFWISIIHAAKYTTSIWQSLLNFKLNFNEIISDKTLLFLKSYYFNARGVFALIPIYMLERIDTHRIRLNKYIGYIFYPAHITVLVIIAFIAYII